MSEMIKINIKEGEEIVKSFAFEKTKVVVGRDPSNDLVIDDIEISRKHLLIFKKGDVFYADDQKSTNGSFVNGQHIDKKTVIKSGDLITLGKDHILEFLIELTPEKAEDITDSLLEETEEKITPEVDSAEHEHVEIVEKEQAPEEIMVAEKKEKKAKEKAKRPTWLIILLAALAFLVIFCVIPLIVIEATNQWCDLFAGFFNSMSPGVCPMP